MLDATLVTILFMAGKYGVCAALTALAIRALSKSGQRPSLNHVLGVGFLIGASYGGLVGVFEALFNRF